MNVEPSRHARLHSLVMVLVVAAAYYATGRLGLLLAIPPGYATAIWPPSGIALAAALMGGYQVWPGVLLGSLLVNIWPSLDSTSIVATLASVAFTTNIAAGAALQAVVGRYLVCRFVGFPSALDREKEIAAFLMLGGPLSCLVNATVGVTTLLASGKIPWAMYPISWWTWWVGDTIGVLIVTPLVLSWLAEPRESWQRRRISVALPLVVAFALTVVFFVYTSNQAREHLKINFERQTEGLAHTLKNRLDDYLGVLHALEGLFASSYEVSRHDFRTFVQHSFIRHPGLQAVSFDARVLDAQRTSYEEVAQRDGYPDFQITEQNAPGQLIRAARRPEYVVVHYIEPYTGNEKALGFDVASGLSRLEALHQARDTGEPVATGRLTLVQETGRQFGWLVFLPVYGNRAPTTTVAERRQSLQGYVTGVFRIDDMVEASLQPLGREGIALRIDDETAPAGQRLLYDSQAQRQRNLDPALDEPHGESPTGMLWGTTFELAGRRWALRFTPTLEYFAARQSLQPWTVLVGGLLFTSLLGAFLLIVTGRAIIIEQRVAERTAELTRANDNLAHEIAKHSQAENRFFSIAQSAVEAIISANSQGHIMTWNHGAYAIFGYTAEEVVGQALSILMPERYREAHLAGIAQTRATGASDLMGKVLELHGLRKDGREFPLELTLSTWATAEGRFYGGIIRDVTERKQIEEARIRLAAIVESSDDAIISYALDGTLLSWNAAAEAMFGYTFEEVQGRSITILRPLDASNQLRPTLTQIKRGQRIPPHDVVRRRKDGTTIDASLTVSPICGTAGNIVGGSSIYRDITQRKRAEETLERQAQALTRANDDLARSNKELEDFAYIASHDLKEPLRGFHTYSTFLLEDYGAALGSDGRAKLQTLERLSLRMDALIDALLDYSRVSRLGQAIGETDLGMIVAEVVDSLAIRLQEAGMEVRITSPLPTVRCDRVRVGEIFRNLVTNAMKYNDKAQKWIEIGCMEAPQQVGAETSDGGLPHHVQAPAVFYVRDNGIGIPARHHATIFRMFKRLHARDKYGGGTGAGLAIVQKIVDSHGGRIWVESIAGEGATFYFTLAPYGRSIDDGNTATTDSRRRG